MTQVFKSILNRGLIEFTVVRNKSDAPGFYRVEYRVFCFCDKRALLNEFINVVTSYLNCMIERTEQDADQGYLYLIPSTQEEIVHEIRRY